MQPPQTRLLYLDNETFTLIQFRPKSEKKRQQIPADYQMLDEALTNNTSTEDVKVNNEYTTRQAFLFFSFF